MTDIEIRVLSTSSAVTETASNALAQEVQAIPGCSLTAAREVGTDVRRRFTGLEIVATVVTSAAATQLARAVRDAVQKRKVHIQLKKADGTELNIRADGAVPIDKVVEFISPAAK